MKTARQSGKVTWWSMGKAAVTKYGTEHALEMANDINTPACRELFLSGVRDEPRPRVRPVVAERSE